MREERDCRSGCVDRLADQPAQLALHAHRPPSSPAPGDQFSPSLALLILVVISCRFLQFLWCVYLL
jgi:hypothetical protein